jgi:amino acid transporter
MVKNSHQEHITVFDRIKRFFIGKPFDVNDGTLVQKISLVAFFAWVGLGADGLSSSSYGPEQAFTVLHGHIYLGLVVALLSAITIFIISASYNQIVELFPHGGGGYLVASKLLSPKAGVVAGSALLIDYVLTITLSVASGTDAIFSFIPAVWHPYKLLFAVIALLMLLLLNLRGIKESITVLIPIFLLFIITHVFLILYSFSFHLSNFSQLISSTQNELVHSSSTLGMFGIIFLILRAYSMGAGTYTGIEAVSNGVSILREPKVKTAKRTMLYMSISLAFMVFGIMLSYVFYNVSPIAGKTMNAVLWETITTGWTGSFVLVFATLLSEALLLFVAAQTGFIGGPRVLSNMAVDKWVPKRFSILSDRLVTQNGIMIMGLSSLILMLFSRGSVALLVVLYSINVFLTFFLSQLGMVKHWWTEKEKAKNWIRKISINGVGLILTLFILISVVILKFREGGWITLFITAVLVFFAIIVKRAYEKLNNQIKTLDRGVMKHLGPSSKFIPLLSNKNQFSSKAPTAVVLVKDFTSMGIIPISTILNSFKGVYRNFVFVQIGLVNAQNLVEIQAVEKAIKTEVDKFIKLVKSRGYNAEGICATGIDTVEKFTNLVPQILKKYPHSNFFGGQVVFTNDNLFSRWLHNYTLFTMQKRLYRTGIPLFIIPIYVK